MALYNIEFKRVEYSYYTETIEANSQEQAAEIANKLLDVRDFEEDISERAVYDEGVNEFLGAYKVERGEGRYKRYATMTADEIADYLQED